ncbi:MAG: NUDIX domain-containing protein [Candidatus Aenigmarchaeota archaeon]|nr:NUDIX domain-containing protein [Candidatus Aenigmarchaeota archaeon]
METLILVDDSDRELGYASREECHAGRGKRHRAFVIFLFNDKKELLVQFRAARKLGGSRWDVSCTSHVWKGETYDTAAERCMKTELGMKTRVKQVLSYVYEEFYKDHAENEYCSLLIGHYNGPISPNSQEMDKIAWVRPTDLEKSIKAKPEESTKWLRIALEQFLKHQSSKEFL